MQPLIERPMRKALVAHHQEVCDLHLREPFVSDPLLGEPERRAAGLPPCTLQIFA